MNAYLFPGQGSQFEGMGSELYGQNEKAKAYYERANEILGFRITDIMFDGTADELKQTKVTQPAVFLHSIIKFLSSADELKPDCVAGHSLGEFTSLVANKALSFEDGLRLVSKRAQAMQTACENNPGTMAAVLGLENDVVEELCAAIDDIVIPANYNCPGQLVISGSIKGVEQACEIAKEKGARRALVLPVGGAFHSPLMKSAQSDLAEAIRNTVFHTPSAPVYQNVNAQAETDPDRIKTNLISQLTAPVRWTQTVEQMEKDGVNKFYEVGAKVLSGFVKRYNRSLETESI